MIVELISRGVVSGQSQCLVKMQNIRLKTKREELGHAALSIYSSVPAHVYFSMNIVANLATALIGCSSSIEYALTAIVGDCSVRSDVQIVLAAAFSQKCNTTKLVTVISQGGSVAWGKNWVARIDAATVHAHARKNVTLLTR